MKTNTIWRNDNYCEWEDYAKTSGDYEDVEINLANLNRVWKFITNES